MTLPDKWMLMLNLGFNNSKLRKDVNEALAKDSKNHYEAFRVALLSRGVTLNKGDIDVDTLVFVDKDKITKVEFLPANIFVGIWRSNYNPTTGCPTLTEEQTLFKWDTAMLEPAKHVLKRKPPPRRDAQTKR